MTLQAQSLDVTPSRVLIDEPAVIRAAGLNPGERVAIQAELRDGAGHRWESQAEFIADATGTVNAMPRVIDFLKRMGTDGMHSKN
jgi:hypothetical protein